MIFPELQGKKFGYVNLNEWAKRWLADEYRGRGKGNPLLNPATCQRMVDWVHKQLGLDYSYGGWMEHRGDLWRCSYLEERRKFLHLGVDVNLPAGTLIKFGPARIIRSDTDYPEPFGWGNRLIIRSIEYGVYFIIGHLDNDSRWVDGECVDIMPLGRIGSQNENGGWYPHVHVQAVTSAHFDIIRKRGFKYVDGYGDPKSEVKLARQFPDPLQFIRLC